jgi:glycerol-3-phosphate acyltransferase PlsY
MGWILASYALGSVSFAQLFVRALSGQNLRDVGSGNLGATNAGRVLGRKYAVLIYLLDFAKGFGPAFFLEQAKTPCLENTPWLPLSIPVALAALLGHCFPIWHGFKGGKGAATGSGAVAALAPMVFVCAMSVFVVAVLLSRMISVGSMLAGLSLPIAWLVLERRHAIDGDGGARLGFLLVLMALVLCMHRKNVERIVRGEEPRIGRKP